MSKKIGLALGGGVVLGVAHIGVLKALEEKKIKIEYISGTSIGSLIGALYAFGKNVEEIEKIALGIKWKELYTMTLSKFALLSNDKIGALLLDNIGDVDFKDAKIPFSVVTTDISDGTKVVLDKGDVNAGVMASTAVPGVFKPIEIKDKLLVDGGIVENVPISAVKELGAEYIIGVDLNTNYSSKRPKNIVEVLLNSFNYIMISSTKLQIKHADISINPNLSEFNIISTDQIEAIIEVGYKEAIKILEENDSLIA